MKVERVKEILAQIRQIKVGVYGDFCLDVYWMLDPRGSEISAETGLPGLAVSKQWYRLGGASNVVANLMALQPAAVSVVGVIGDDVFARELLRQLQLLNVHVSRLVIQAEKFDTYAFCKRILENQEIRRIDFGFFNQRSLDTDQRIVENLYSVIPNIDVLIINQQIPGSFTNDSFIDQLNKLTEDYPDKIILVDSRHFAHRFHHVYLKTNDMEVAWLNNVRLEPDQMISINDIRKFTDTIYSKQKKPIFITRGAHGLVVRDESGFYQVPGIQLLNKIDPVGAGDTVMSALACCLATGAAPVEAAVFANFAAAVTVQKLFQTGTASPEEIISIASDPDYIYQPELAEDIRHARYYQNTEIEVCCNLSDVEWGKIRHAVFDHDGTISSLRQGWEEIMELMMIKAILGDQYETADETLYHKVRSRVLEYIDKSTGIQTILQMEALVELVREFGIVRAEQVLDKFQYKAIYNEELLKMVHRRLEKLQRGELDVADFTIKGAVDFVKELNARGVTLYLASGTDAEDVAAEARALGYDALFNGGIYGAVGDVKKYSKKIVIERILSNNRLSGPELAVFGDGPVEIREARKHHGIAVAVASDELRRYGLKPEKRTRLIHGGAHLVVPDFSQREKLLEFLFKNKQVD